MQEPVQIRFVKVKEYVSSWWWFYCGVVRCYGTIARRVAPPCRIITFLWAAFVDSQHVNGKLQCNIVHRRD